MATALSSQGRARRGLSDAWWCGIAVAMPALQLVALHAMPTGGLSGISRPAIFIATTAALVFVAMHFRRYLGAWAAAAGVVMNLLPTLAHGGLMPAVYDVMRDSGRYPGVTEASVGHQLDDSKGIVLWRDDIQFEWFADRYEIYVSGALPNLFSVGDFFLFGGLAAAAVQAAGMFAIPASRRVTAAR